jgi:hypothetical protein
MEKMTVKELLEKLKKCNPEAKIVADGCDCYGSAVGVELDEWDGEEQVIISRTGNDID